MLLKRFRGAAVFALLAAGLTAFTYSSAAAPTATGAFNVSLTTTQKNAVDFGTASFTATLAQPYNYTVSGTGAGQIDRAWSDSSRILASAADTIDLAGTVTDGFGAIFTCVKMKSLVVVAMPGNVTNIEIGGASTNNFKPFTKDTSDIVVLPPGYAFGVGGAGAGIPVTAGTGDKLMIKNGGATAASYKINAACTSA